MTTPTLGNPANVLSTTLMDIAQGLGTMHSNTGFVVQNSDLDDAALDSDDSVVAFTGTNFGSFDSNGIPHSGTVTQIQTQDFMLQPTGTLINVNLAVLDLLSFVTANNLAGLEAAVFSGADMFNGTTGPDNFSGFAGNDTFNLTQGGIDTVSGGTGNDTINMGAALTAADKIDAGAGTDTVTLNGNYAAGVTFNATTMVNVEKLTLAAGHSYKLTTNNATVASGQTLTINGAALSASNVLTFNGAAETNGHFIIIGGNGADVLTGGALSDTFTYTAAAQSTGVHYDTINGFNFSSDKFDIPGGAGVITGINAKVTSGTLSTASFDANLTTAMSDGHLGAHHAVLFTPTTGTLHGQTFLVVDLNGVAGYQSGHDLVIRMNGAAGTLAAGGFH